MRSLAGAALALLLAAGCASRGSSTPQQPRPVDPVGVFDFSTEVEGSAVTGTIEVLRSSSGYGGSIGTSVTETIPVRSVVVEGQTVTVVGETPDGPVTIVLAFTGNTFTGSWTLGAMSGSMTGKRRGT